VVEESIYVAEHQKRAPKLALALDLRASRGDWDSKSGPKSAQKEASDDDNSPRCRQPYRDDVARWNEALCSLFSSVFFQSSTNSA
jgi:hypothetical protein